MPGVFNFALSYGYSFSGKAAPVCIDVREHLFRSVRVNFETDGELGPTQMCPKNCLKTDKKCIIIAENPKLLL